MSITTESCQQGQIESLKKQLADKEKQNKELTEQLEDDTRQVHQLFKENEELKKEVSRHRLMAGNLDEENKELEKKSNAKSDIIRNMFDFITEDPEEVQEGFTINREWGHKYIDGWNDIVSEEMKAVVKDINKELDGDEMEWRTDGYEFSLHIKDEEEEEAEEVVQGSKVDMNAFNKLKENGMMPWSK